MFVAVLLCFLLQCVSCNTEIVEPQCPSSYDFLHKLMYKVIKMEEDVKNFRIYIDELKDDRENEKKEYRVQLASAIVSE